MIGDIVGRWTEVRCSHCERRLLTNDLGDYWCATHGWLCTVDHNDRPGIGFNAFYLRFDKDWFPGPPAA